jgi:hypothetical protein
VFTAARLSCDGDGFDRLRRVMLALLVVCFVPQTNPFTTDIVSSPMQYTKSARRTRIDIAEGPFIGRDLAVGVLEPLAPEQN